MSLASLVIFDCDGVLIDSEAHAGPVLADFLAEVGMPVSVAECHTRYRGRTFADCLVEIEAALGKPVPDGWFDRLRDATHRAIDENVAAMPRAREMLAQLPADGTPVCVASSSGLAYLERVLAATDLLPFFGKNVFSAQMVTRGKPAPDLFLHAAAQMGHAPAHCLVIEDSLPGIRAARAAGMRVLGYVSDSYCDAELLIREGAEIIHDLDDVPARLRVAA